MICKTCGSNIPDGSAYCLTCGAAVVAEPAAPVPPAEPAAPFTPPAAPACVYCGTPLLEGAAFCTNCGNPQPTGAPAATGVPYTPTAPAAPKEKKPFPTQLILLGAGVLALIVTLVIILASCGGGDPEDVAQEYVECVFSGDIEGALELIPEDLLDEAMEKAGKELDEYIEEAEEEIDRELDKGDIDVDDAYEADYFERSRLRDIQEKYEELDIEVENAAEVKVPYVVEYLGLRVPDSTNITVIEVDGDWYVDVSEMSMID